MPLVVRELDEAFAAQRAVILFVLMPLLVLLQCILHLKLLPAGAALVRLLVNHHVRLQFFYAAEGLVTFRTSPVVFLHMNLQVFVKIFWEGVALLTLGAIVTLTISCFAMGHYVPFQMIHSAKYFAAVVADEAPRAGLDLLV